MNLVEISNILDEMEPETVRLALASPAGLYTVSSLTTRAEHRRAATRAERLHREYEDRATILQSTLDALITPAQLWSTRAGVEGSEGLDDTVDVEILEEGPVDYFVTDDMLETLNE